jgi:hypothetical protein
VTDFRTGPPLVLASGPDHGGVAVITLNRPDRRQGQAPGQRAPRTVQETLKYQAWILAGMTLWTAREQAPARTPSEADFAVPIGDRHFEDYQEGAVYEYGYATVDGDELVAFAHRFDP